MGYWIYKDPVTWTARVHRADSTNPNCKWEGASEGAPPPPTWEYVEELPIDAVIVTSRTRNRQIRPVTCLLPECMNGVVL